MEEDSAPGKQGLNDFDRVEYGGPCPPSGERRYFFRVWSGGGTEAFRCDAMEGRVIESCELMGKYYRN